MKMKKLLSLLLVACFLLSGCANAPADENTSVGTPADEEVSAGTPADEEIFAGGKGTEENPYQIATVDQLLAFAASVNDGSAKGYAEQFVILTEDLDLTGIDWTPIGSMADMETYSTMFFGTFDGQGHTISNLTLDMDTPIVGAGIFGMNLGEVRNLRAENIQIHCTDTYSMAVGAVVGYNMGGLVHDIVLTGENEIAAVNAIGGICGGSTGRVYNCTVEGTTVIVQGDNDFSSGRIIQEDIAECGGLIIGGSFGGTLDNCTAKGKIIATGNEPVGLGGIGGCLEMMDSVTNCTADVEIVSEMGGHAIGGLCGYSGTHHIGDIALATEGVVATNYPGIIDNCHVTVKMNVPGATHVGGLVGTGLYYYGEETAFQISNCSVEAEIIGAVTPGAVAGRAVGSLIESCDANVTLDGEELTASIGETLTMYESGDQFEEERDDAETAAAQLLNDLTGTYDELFTVLSDPAYDQLWIDDCAAIVGEEAAPEVAMMLKSACMGELYGEEAVAAYSGNPESALFDCYFINGVSQFVFDGNQIAGLDKNGEELFRHEYAYVGEVSIAGMLDGYLYETPDEDAGDFRYFLLLPDTPDTTWHIEFRYGSDAEAMTLYDEGPLAYWLAAGIPADRDQQLIENVIQLFCEENLAGMEMEDAA